MGYCPDRTIDRSGGRTIKRWVHKGERGMKQRQKAILVTGIILAGYIIFGIFSYVLRHNYGMGYPHGGFLFPAGDRYMDFFNVNQMVSGNRPYQDYRSSYPPLILVIAKVFSLFADYLHVAPQEIKNTTAGKLSLWICMGGFTLLNASLMYVTLKKRADGVLPMILRWIVVIALVCTAPYIFMIDRGNYLIISLLFFMGFAFFYGENDTLAAIFLGLTAAIKIYPLFFGLIYLLDRKWLKMLIFILSGGLLTLITFAFWNGGLMENVIAFKNAVTSYGEGHAHEALNVYFSVGLTSAIRFPYISQRIYDLPLSSHPLRYYVGIGTMLTLMSLWCLFREKQSWKKIMVLSALMVWLTPNSYMYNLTYMIPSVLLYIMAEPTERKWVDIVYACILGLMLIPKAYYYFVPEFYISVAIIIDAILLPALVLFYILFDRTSREKFKWKKQVEA